MKSRPVDLRVVLLLLALGLLGGVVGCSSSSKKPAAAKQASFDASGLLTPVTAAPPLALRNYLGRPVDIQSYKGKVVLVTFIYTHCPDVCPLITSNLRVAQALMPPAVRSKVAIVAVSVDSKGDTPKAVGAFLARHEMTGRMQYLVGSTHELAPVWQAWGVGSERDAAKPELINHSGLVYGVTASGKRLTIYASNFQPAEIAHDVPLLAVR
ncbi:MAG: SCO family protein [Actinobacteria bacterium]|nr:MAG: SCO family protein [Actinomycetota bacterium]